MSNFMDRFMGKRSAPAQSAKDRLKFVLVADRTTLSPEDLRQMQSEILEVIRKYCRVKEDEVEMKFEQRERENYLVADIPLRAGRDGESGGTVRVETTLILGDESGVEDSLAPKPLDVVAPEAPKPAEPVKEAEAPLPANLPEAPSMVIKEPSGYEGDTERVVIKNAPSGLTDEKKS
jgi:cell division topological specificity factor